MTPDLPPSAPPPGQLPVAPEPVQSQEEADRKDIDMNKDIAAFSYLWIMSVIVYFLRRHSPFVRFHATQAIILFILSIIVLFVPVISRLLMLGVLALMVMGFLNAAQGKRKDIPIVGPLSRREIGLRDAWKQLLEKIVWLVSKMKGMVKKEKKPDPPRPNPPSSNIPNPPTPQP